MPGQARTASLSRRFRSAGGRVIRRLGLLPAGTPDGVGQDAELMGRPWPFEVMVYFADTTEALYQIEQWYPTFQALHAHRPLVVVTRDSRTAAAIRRDSGLQVRTIAHYTTLDDILARSATTLALYVNHNPENFQNLRFGQLVHASLMHGDSDKLVTVSNQTKAYDFSFVAGQAAIDRMARYATLYDAHARCIAVGRPQLDEQTLRRAARAAQPDAVPTVLYAPTWEGGQPTAAYGSVASHGPAIVRALVSSGRYRVVYRPHPLTGVRDGAYGDADALVRELLRTAPPVRAGVPHVVDTGPDLAESFALADLMICDVSGVAMDWLATGAPMILTVPTADVVVAQTPLSAVVPSLSVQELPGLVELVDAELTVDAGREERRRLTEYYLGDTTPGAATRRFLEACDRLIEIRDAEMARIEQASAQA